MYTRAQRVRKPDAAQHAEQDGQSTEPVGQLTVGAADDRYEREADRVAAEVVGRLGQPELVGAAAGGAQVAPVARRLQRRAATVGAEGGEMPASVESEIQSARGGGSQLDASARAPMEQAFGADFGSVRVHEDSRASALNDTLQAKAFTVGNDIFFRGAAPDAGTAGGQELLAHELAHTVQQGGGSPAIQRWSLFGKKDSKPKVVDKQKQAKEQEVAERLRLKAEREKGNEQRTKLKEQVGNDPSALGSLTERFNKALTDESNMRLSLVKGGKTPEEAETEAYAKIWLAASPDLRALRPMRETRAEKLVGKTLETRNELSSQKNQEQSDKDARGTLVSKAVEDTMVKELEEVQRLIEAGEPESRAQKIANTKIWAAADPKVVAKRPPVGSKVEAAAYEIAKKRVASGRKPKQAPETVEVLDTIGNIGQGVTGVTSGVGKGINKLFDDGNKKTLSVGEKVGGGMSSISDMVSGVLSSVVGIKDFVVLVNRLVNQPTVDFNDIGEAIKAALGELGQMSKNVASAMKIAGALSESALASVASMIPIVDVISNSIAVAGGISEAVPNAMRYGSNLGDIYLSRAADRPELVLALKRLGQRNAQLLEQSLYKTTSAITKLSLGIAQLATGGADMGATTAIKYVVSGIDAVHSLSHLIADNVFAVQGKGARKQLTGRTEGSAEEVLRRDAGYAVDALLTAATKGDKKTQWLARGALEDSYGVKIDKGDATELNEAHDRILRILQESSDPKTLLDKLKGGVAGVKSKARGMSDASADVKTLASARNAQDGGDRGFGWRMKMWFKSNGALARRVAAHNVEHGTNLETAKGKRQGRFKASAEDPNIIRPKVQESLIKEMENMTIDQLQAAAKDEKRSQFERIVFSQAAAEKLKADMVKGGK